MMPSFSSSSSFLCCSSSTPFLLVASAILLLFTGPSSSSANPIAAPQQNGANPKAANFFLSARESASSPAAAAAAGFFPSASRNWMPPQAPMLLPYAQGNGFISPFPSGLSDRWSGFLADEQFAPNKRTPAGEGHFMEPAGWLGLGEPGRFEWNFNRLR